MDRSGVSWKTILGMTGLLIMFLCIVRCGWINRNDRGGNTIVRSITSDTVYVTVYDTLFVDRPVPVERRVVDTVYMRIEDRNLSLPVEQLRYNKDGVYDIWVSGVKASLDSVKVYVPTTERTVTRTVTMERKASWACVPYMGFKAFDGSVSPNIGFMLETPKSWVLGAEIGYSKPLSTHWGVNVGYRFGR